MDTQRELSPRGPQDPGPAILPSFHLLVNMGRRTSFSSLLIDVAQTLLHSTVMLSRHALGPQQQLWNIPTRQGTKALPPPLIAQSCLLGVAVQSVHCQRALENFPQYS